MSGTHDKRRDISTTYLEDLGGVELGDGEGGGAPVHNVERFVEDGGRGASVSRGRREGHFLKYKNKRSELERLGWAGLGWAGIYAKCCETYGGVNKVFILHTNCFAEHFVFE